MRLVVDKLQRNVGGLWGSIADIWKMDEKIGRIVNTGIHQNIGYGNNTMFWEDIRVDDMKLMEKFARLYYVSTLKRTLIVEYGFWDRLMWIWNLQW